MTMTIDDMPVNEAIALYNEKHRALRDGDMLTLLDLRKKHPDLFDKEKDEQMRDMIEYMLNFQASKRYKELQKMEMRKKLRIIRSDENG